MTAKNKATAADAAPVVSLQTNNDSLSNVASGLGGVNDKSAYTRYILSLITREECDAAFRSNWIARKAIQIPADDATRAWRTWQADKADITKIEEAERALGLQSKLRRAEMRARLYGGGALIMGINSETNVAQELDVEKIRKGDLVVINAVSRWQLQTVGQLNRDVTSPYYGQPEMFRRMDNMGRQYDIHPSRVIRLLGPELPDDFMDGEGWGDSVLQSVNAAIMDAGTVNAAVAGLVHEAKFDVIRIPGLADKLSTKAGSNRLVERFTNSNLVKSYINSLLIDKEEEWQRVATQFATLPEVVQTYLMIVSGAVDIPATRFLAQSPAGMNATGESDTRNYYDRVSSDQNNRLKPALSPLDEVLIRSALGARPDDIFYNWVPLWQMTEEQKAKVAESEAKVFQTDLDSGLFSQATLRTARSNQLIERSVYPGFEEAVEDDEDERADEEGVDVPTDPVTGEPMAIAPDGKPVTAEPQKEALNGTQITSLREIVEAVAGEQIPPESGKAMLRVAFPTLEEEEINAIIDPLASFEPKADPVELAKAEALANPKPMPGAPGAGGAAHPAPAARARPLPRAANDAQPRTLYVHRDVLNVEAISKWAAAQGIKGIRPDMHVTIAYSEAPVDWMKVGEGWEGDEKGRLMVKPGGVRLMEAFGPTKDALVLLFTSSALSWRHEQIKQAGASWKWADFQPHITIAWGWGGADVSGIEPYRGEIVLGPEVFEEVDEDWKSKKGIADRLSIIDAMHGEGEA